MSFVEDEGTQSTMLQPPPAATPVVSQQMQPKTASRRVQPAPADGERQPSVGSVDQGTRSCSTATTRPDTSLKEKFMYNVLSKYWLEAVVGLGAVGFSILIVLVTCFVALPQLKPNCTVKSTNGDWTEWTRCECGDSFAFTTRQYSSKDDSPPFCNNKTQTRRCPRWPCCNGFGQTFNGSSWCFGFDGRHVSWGQARQEAASDDVGNLASIHSDQEMQFIRELWQNGSTLNKFTRFWIGFRCFRVGYCEWVDGSEYDFVLGQGETFANNNKVLCAYMDFKANGSKFADCDTRLPFVKKTVNLFVRANCSTKVERCYDLHEQSEWSKAHEMAIISSAKELMFIKAFPFVRDSTQPFWLGLQCSGDLDQSCVWKDGTRMTFSNWSANAQQFNDTFCVVMNSDGGWDPRDCKQKHKYITETEPHCDKIGQHYWSSWSECECRGLTEQMRQRHRGTKVNGSNDHSAYCPHYIPYETQEENCNEKQCAKCPKDESFTYCYKISVIQKSYKDIEQDLVAIGSKQENDYLMKLLHSTSRTPRLLLIGLVCEHNQQLDYCMWSSTGERLTLNKFGPGQPRVINDDHKCVAIHVQSELWVSVDCNTEYNYIQEHRPACDKFINYTKTGAKYKPMSECNETSGLRKFGATQLLNCPLVEQEELRSCFRNCTPDYEKEIEYCYKVVDSKASFTSLTLEKWDHTSPVLAVMLDDKHARFINQRVVPAAFKNKAEPKPFWLGFTCGGRTQCFWEYNEGEFDPTEIAIKSQIDIKRKDDKCGLLDWKLDTNNSALKVDDCNVELEYVLEMAPGCDKFHRFSSIEYKCDQPLCGTDFCFPTDSKKNCPHYTDSHGSCCVGETNDDIFGCYSSVQLEGEGGEGMKAYEALNLVRDIPNLGDPFSKKTVRLWRKKLIKFNSGLYLTSVDCSDDLVNCERRVDPSKELPSRMRRFLRVAVNVNTTGVQCAGRCSVLFNSYTKNLELDTDFNTVVNGYITQYAKHNDTESDQFTLLHCRPENKGLDDIYCPVNGRCCHGNTAAHVYACYDIVIKPNVTFLHCEASYPNLADLSKNTTDVHENFILVAVVKLFQEIIQNDTGRYWTNLRCSVLVEGQAICNNHYESYFSRVYYNWPSITRKCTFGQDCCSLVYDSSLRGLNTQECSSTENISGYILQYPKYVFENGRLDVSDCYHDAHGDFSSLEQRSKETEKYCPTKGDEACIHVYKQTLY